jgi:hypothetical protein
MYQHSKEENLLEMQWHLLLLPEKKKKKRSPAESNRLQFCFESRCKTTMTTRVRNAKHEKYIRSGKREGGKKCVLNEEHGGTSNYKSIPFEQQPRTGYTVTKTPPLLLFVLQKNKNRSGQESIFAFLLG